MEYTDVAVIGGGLLGCFAVRALTAYELQVTVLEEREDVCTGVSRSNTGIVYTGYDTKPGTLKTRLCVQANLEFDQLCRELDVPFSRCGSLMAGFGPRAEKVLEKKLAQGQANGVPGLELLEPEAVYTLEPNLAPGVRLGLYAPGTGTVNPWELGIAAFENARDNGAVFRFSEKLLHMERTAGGYRLETERGCYAARAVVNCAGLQADAVRELVRIPAIRIFPTAGDYLVLDDTVAGFIRHVIFHEPEEKGKGLTLVPTVDGNLLIGPTERSRDSAPDWATSQEGLETLYRLCAQVVPALPMNEVIRSFAALRPNPFEVRELDGWWIPQDKSISGFTILEEDGLISLLGIKTPGLTCARLLGEHIAECAARFLGGPGRNLQFNPYRRGIRRVHELDEAERDALIRQDPDYGEVVCQCRDVTKGEVLEAIRRGAATADGVKRRTGAGMGRCQGSRCGQTVMELVGRTDGIF
ncbi:MAG: NAD(P)/FAD-dependent oxidoreductase [Oscillospiraceae bacterium]|nr:NAD(P)/FAD-dependent oxidoreductase [Oscillospiraceae bacterium]